MIDWRKIEPDEFELLCYQLLGKLNFVNRDWYRGPGDGGRDIVAVKYIEDIPGQINEQKWIIECKRKTTRSLGISDLSEGMERAAKHKPDRYLVITTTHLTVDTKDWIKQKAERLGMQAQYIEKHDLEELLRRYKTPLGQKIMISQLENFIDPVFVAQQKMDFAFDTILTENIPTFKEIKRLTNEYKKIQKESNEIPHDINCLCLNEKHTINYLENGISTTNCEITLINISNSELRNDNFRIYGDKAVDDNSSLNIKSFGLDDREKQPISFRLDTGNLKLIDFKLPKGIYEGQSHDYGFTYDWPYPLPLENIRYYNTFGRRYKYNIEVYINIPSHFIIDKSLAILTYNGYSRRLPIDKKNTNSLYFSYKKLQRNSNLNIIFQVRKENKNER